MKLKRLTLQIVTLLGILSLMVVSTAQARTLAFTDPIADQTGTVDVIGMVMTFSKTGHYRIDLTASPDHPFVGQFRVNVNLYNPEVSAKARFFSFACKNCAVFDPAINHSDFNISVPTTTLTLMKGKSKVLKTWDKGDQVAISSFAGLGTPPGVSVFRSAVANMPFSFLTNEDTLGYNNLTADGVTDGVAIVSP